MALRRVQELAEILKFVFIKKKTVTILAFFPEHKMKDFRSPSVEEMVRAYEAVRSIDLTNVRLGNVGICARTEKDREYLMAHVDSGAY